MLIGVPRETRPGETRVATTPKHVEQLRGLGYDVIVESGAGLQAGFHDDDYVAAGAGIGDRDQACAADVVMGIHAPARRTSTGCATARWSSPWSARAATLS